MLNEKEAQDLMDKFIELNNQAKKTKSSSDIRALELHKNICVDNFKYLVMMRTSKYKQFHNYQDLIQEGLEALTRAMLNYNPKKGIFFYWAHKYIDTKISRSASLHTVIRFPLKYARATHPRKETTIPTLTVIPALIDDVHMPDLEYENKNTEMFIRNAISNLPENKRKVIELAFGFGGQRPASTNKICKSLNLTRSVVVHILRDALKELKQTIKL